MLKKEVKRLIGVCLMLSIAVILSLTVYADSDTSDCSNCDYEFNSSTGHLTIGKVIENKNISDIVPFSKDKIKEVTIEDDVTTISKNAFRDCIGC